MDNLAGTYSKQQVYPNSALVIKVQLVTLVIVPISSARNGQPPVKIPTPPGHLVKTINPIEQFYASLIQYFYNRVSPPPPKKKEKLKLAKLHKTTHA